MWHTYFFLFGPCWGMGSMLHNILNSYMLNSCTVAGVQNDIFPFNFQIEQNHNRVNNEFFIANEFNNIPNIEDLINIVNKEESHDIRSNRYKLTNLFSFLTLSQSDEMQIRLFHLLKASTTLFILFDWIINLFQMYKHTIIQNGTHHLMKHEMTIQYFYSKWHAKGIITNPLASNIVLSYYCSTHVVTFYAWDIILHIVMNKSLFSTSNLLLVP